MKKIIVISILILAFAACKKDRHHVPTTTAPDTFIFARDGGFCQQCYVSYMVQGNQLFRDSIYSSPGTFHKVPMADSSYAIAQPLVSSLPAYLLSRPNISVGCGGCADESVLHIYYIKGTDTTFWNLDTAIPIPLPTEVTDYMTQLQNVLNRLN